ncbi:glutathione ABC transporter permease [Luteimicrobium album]|uniref:Glutathione ABC transporter permease n=1 Tax=Luteimicrobium album TaxID=1054550 RepID=A0ABQ6I2K9_9MICO|nr:ABC transporter permease [Luteimicrobium album]GMA24188.1 glutathione ABC transporter permease [Luteimicrobium album]
MLRFIGRRIVALIPVVIIVTALSFMLVTVMPGDAALANSGIQQNGVSDAALAQARAELGLDKPPLQRYLSWLGGLLHGDLGTSFRLNTPVSHAVFSRLPITLEVGLLAILLALVIGGILGVVMALRANKTTDVLLTVVSFGGIAIPPFWLGALLVFVVSLTWGLLPPSGYVAFADDPVKHLQLLVLPVITVAVAPAAILARQIRGAVLDALGQEYTVAARARGANRRRVVLHHVLKNASVPVISAAGLQVGGVVGGAILAETIFTVPGVGLLLVDSISGRDYPVILGLLVVLSSLVLVINLITDIVYAVVDPRIRYE